MKFLSIYFAFISILMVNCHKFESVKSRFLEPIACKLNCLDKEDPSNIPIIANDLEYYAEFQINNFTKPLNEFCNQLNSNLLDKINKAEDILDENFQKSFDQRAEQIEKKINDLNQKGLNMMNNFKFIGEIDQLNQTKYIKEQKIIFKEIQNCRINYLNDQIILNTQTKIVKIKFNKENGQKKLSKEMDENSIAFLNMKSVLNYLKLSGKLQSFIRFAIEDYCHSFKSILELTKMNSEEYCNQFPKYL